MAPDPRVVKAFRAMKALGISADRVKPVLKKLLRLYDKNWELIEEENYRVLIDAVFDDDDAERPEKKQNANEDHFEETLVNEETERPLKRLCHGLRTQDEKVDPPANNSNANASVLMLKVPKEEKLEVTSPADNCWQPLHDKRKSRPTPVSPNGLGGNNGKQPVISESLSPHIRHLNKGKEPMFAEVSPKQKAPGLDRGPWALQIKYGETDSEILRSPKHVVPDNGALIKPKDEPFTDYIPLDDTPCIEAPISMIWPEESSAQNASKQKARGQKTPASKSVAGGDGAENPSNGKICNSDVMELVIATSSSGEAKLVINCNSTYGRPGFRMPTRDELLELMQQKCLPSYKILDPNFSVEEFLRAVCDGFVEQATDSYCESQNGLTNAAPTLDALKKSAAYNALHGDGVTGSET